MKQLTIQMVKPQGYCGGVLKAISIAKQCREDHPNEKITILGNLVHNTFVQKSLQYHNIETLDIKGKTRLELLDYIHDGIIIFTAHGISQAVRKKAIEKNLQVVDASCPFVLQTQKIVQQKLDEGYTIFYIGKYQHPEAEAIYSSSENVYLIEKGKPLPTIESNKIFVTNQTTMSMLDIQSIFEDILQQYPHAIIHDEICNATRVRQQAILDLEGQGFDTLVVVGDPTSNNTKQLGIIGQKANIQNILKVESIDDIDLNDFKDSQKVAITSGASTPTYLTNQIYNYLSNRNEKEKIRIQDIL